jgi:quercetin dioxygenase-like cupin family protein
MTVDLYDVQPKNLIPGFSGRFVHTDQVTLAFWDVEAGAQLPVHSHVHEQTTYVLEGRFELIVEGEAKLYEPGLVAVIPSHAVHSGTALTNCKILDVFAPVREEYK